MNKKISFVLPALAFPFVLVACQSKQIKTIEVTTNKLVYQVGEVITKDDFNVNVIYSDKTEKELKSSEWTSKVNFPYRLNHLDKNNGYASIDVRFGNSKTSHMIGVAPFFEFDTMPISYDDTDVFKVPLYNDECEYLDKVQYKIYDKNSRIEFKSTVLPSNEIKMKSGLLSSTDQSNLWAVLDDGTEEGFLLDACTITSQHGKEGLGLDDNNNLKISGSATTLSLPCFFRGNRVEKLVNNANNSLQKITLPATLKEISDTNKNGVFSGASSLTEVDTSNCECLSKLGENTFKSCPLTKFVIPASLEEIGDNCFDGCTTLEEIDTSNSALLRTLGKSAFNSCYKIKKINIPASLEEINASCFSGCTDLASLNIPAENSLCYVDVSAFTSCSEELFKEEKVSSSDDKDTYVKVSVEGSDNDHYILYNMSTSRDKWEINNDCKFIASDCSATTETLTLPSNLEVIGHGALANLTLDTITIPSSVKTIGRGSLLKAAEIKFENDNHWYYYDNNEEKYKKVEKSVLSDITALIELIKQNDIYHLC